MAEIHVQTKKSSSSSMWIWIVLAIIIIAAVAYYLMNRNRPATTVTPPANTTGAIQYFVGQPSIRNVLQQNTATQPRDNNIHEPKALLS